MDLSLLFKKERIQYYNILLEKNNGFQLKFSLSILGAQESHYTITYGDRILDSQNQV